MPDEMNLSPPVGLWNNAFRFHFRENTSTSSSAMEWLRESQPGQMAIFTTDHQRQGRGQNGKVWQHRKNQDLAWSLAVHFSEPLHAEKIASNFWMQLNLALTDRLRRCVTRAIDAKSSAEIRIKWPNDLYVFHECSWNKCSGILVENHWKGSEMHGFVIGVGINVAPLDSHLPWIGLQSLSEEKVTIAHVQFLLEQELQGLLPLNNLHLEPLTPDRINRYHAILYGWQETLLFRYQQNTHSAKFLGINSEGQAQVQWIDGPNAGLITSHMSSGELQWL